MIVLDTNVLSALMREPAELPVAAWLDRQPGLSVRSTAITVMEPRHGIELLAAGRMKRRLEHAMERLIGELLAGRVAS